MPTYQYRCTEGHEVEVVQAFTDDALRECPQCGAPVRKVYGSVGVVFKGSGFYRNDSRDSNSTASPAKSGETKSDGAATKSDKTKSDTKSETKSAGKSETKSSSSSSSSGSSASAGSAA